MVTSDAVMQAVATGADREHALEIARKERERKISKSQECMYAAHEVNQKEKTPTSQRKFGETQLMFFDTVAAAWKQYDHDIETINRVYDERTTSASYTIPSGTKYTRGEQLYRRPGVHVDGHQRRQ